MSYSQCKRNTVLYTKFSISYLTSSLKRVCSMYGHKITNGHGGSKQAVCPLFK